MSKGAILNCRPAVRISFQDFSNEHPVLYHANISLGNEVEV